jgi:transketolase
MKRKIFSKLLMGALLIASVSSFVSCKDYDDDIDNLQKQIDAAALKTSLDALQQKVDQNATTAAAAAAQALKAAQDAATAASNGDASLQTAINEAKAAAEAAAKTNADNIKDATDAIAKLNAAIEQAKAVKGKPALIIGKCIMGKGALKDDGSSYEANCKTHGAPLGGEAFKNTVKNLGGDPENPFQIFDDVKELYANRAKELEGICAERYAEEQAWAAATPEKAAQ